MSDSEEEPPKWFKKFFHQFLSDQAEQSSSKHNRPSPESTVPPAKRHKSQGGEPLPHFSATPPPHTSPDSDDEFDARYGHLFGHNINNEASDSEHHDPPDESRDHEQEGLDSVHQSDGEESVDEALVELVDKVPNWEPYSQLNKFTSENF